MLKRLINRVLGREDGASADDATSAQVQRLLDAYVNEGSTLPSYLSADFQALASAKAIAALDPQTKVHVLALTARRLKDATTPQITQLNEKRVATATALQELLVALVRPEMTSRQH